MGVKPIFNAVFGSTIQVLRDLASFGTDTMVKGNDLAIFLFSEGLFIDVWIHCIQVPLTDLFPGPPIEYFTNGRPILSILNNQLPELVVFFVGPLLPSPVGL